MANNFIDVPMCKEYDEIGLKKYIISTDANNYIIGTQSLATCIGILLYETKSKRAIVLHVPSNLGGYDIEHDVSVISFCLLSYIKNQNFKKEDIKYLVVPGADEYFYKNNRVKNVANGLNLVFEKEGFEKMQYEVGAVRLNDELKSLCFAFDSSNGEFVTSKYYPNTINYSLDGKKYNFTKINKNRGILILSDIDNYDEIDVLKCEYHTRIYKKQKDYEVLKKTLLKNFSFDVASTIKRDFNSNHDIISAQEDNKIIIDNFEELKKGYILCESDEYYDVIPEFNFEEYLKYFDFEDICHTLKTNENLQLTNKVYRVPNFFSFEEKQVKKY